MVSNSWLFARAHAPLLTLSSQDMVNRKISMKILVEMAAIQYTRQFILLTPQSLMFETHSIISASQLLILLLTRLATEFPSLIVHYLSVFCFFGVDLFRCRSMMDQQKLHRKIDVKMIKLRDPIRNQGTLSFAEPSQASSS